MSFVFFMIVTKPSKKPSPNPTTQTGGGTNQGNRMTQRFITRLPKRLFSFGNWMPGNIPGMQQQGWCGTIVTNPSQPTNFPIAVGVPAPQPNR